MIKSTFACTVAAAALLSFSSAQAVVIADFQGGIGPVVNHPDPGVFDTWYDITSDAFATPSAGTLSGSPALSITDGGFTNGVYVIYDAVVPASGEYYLSALMDVVEDTAATNGIRDYQMGVVVNGAHRAAAGDLAAINPADAGSGIASFSGLTTGDDNALPPQIIMTDSFFANAGDNLLIAFSTDLTSGNFDLNSGGWGTGGPAVLVDNIELNVVPEPASLGLLGLAGLALARRRRA